MAQVTVDSLILDVQNHLSMVLGQLRAELNKMAAENEKLRAELAAEKPVADDHK